MAENVTVLDILVLTVNVFIWLLAIEPSVIPIRSNEHIGIVELCKDTLDIFPTPEIVRSFIVNLLVFIIVVPDVCKFKK